MVFFKCKYRDNFSLTKKTKHNATRQTQQTLPPGADPNAQSGHNNTYIVVSQ